MKYKGDLEGFPQEVVEWMCDQQEAQGNKRDISVFEKNREANRYEGGFDWLIIDNKLEVRFFCNKVIRKLNFDLFFEHFPKKENINDILEECKRRFPQGSKVVSPNRGEQFTISTKSWLESPKNSWLDGIYYSGNGSVLAMIEGKDYGEYLYCNGKYATLAGEDIEVDFSEVEKEEQQEYPKVMWCWDDDVSKSSEYYVIGKLKNAFMCIEINFLKEFESDFRKLYIFTRGVHFYKNASLTKPVKEYTREQALKEFNINIID